MMTDVTIREAVENDLAACAKIINDYIDETDWLPRTLSRNEMQGVFTPDMLASRYFLVAEKDGVIGGYLSMDVENGKIPGLYLARRFRCGGTGKALIERAKRKCPQGLSLTVFEPNQHAKRFYEREGFVEIAEQRSDETPEGVPVLTMRWNGEAR